LFRALAWYDTRGEVVAAGCVHLVCVVKKRLVCI
jgi:hypothetical protein